MAPGAPDLLRAVGLLVDGPVVWGRPVRSSRPGVYVVELPAPLESAPLDLARVGKWLERAVDLLLDGERPTSRALAARLARDWLPGQTVLFVGSTDGPLADRVAAIQATPPGDPLPCPDGLRLHLLRGIEACRVWWAATDAPEEYADAVLDAFAAGVGPAAAAALGGFVAPFAVLRRPTGDERPTGITGALLPAPVEPQSPPKRVVEVPPAQASRQVGAPAPRAVARPGSAPASGSVPRRRPPAAAVTAGQPDASTPAERPPAASTDGAPASSRPDRPGVEPVYLSREGLARLEAELRELRVARRPEIVRRVAAARELGDLRENSEYHAAREELGFLDGRIHSLDARLRAAVVVEDATAGGRSTLGSTLVIESDGEEQTLRLVSSTESDYAAGRISVASPVGKALVGLVAGQEVTVTTPAGPVVYRVVRVE
jgi:transcription elongation factor GreA